MNVSDPYGVIGDEALPSLAQALDPDAAAAALNMALAAHPRYANTTLRSISVTRYKPGRRCLLEYGMELADGTEAVLIGKVRRKRSGIKDFNLVGAIYGAGMREGGADGIATPEPVAHVESLHLWLQRKVAGAEASALIGGPRGREVARRAAEAAYKIHCTEVPPRFSHSMMDELEILFERLEQVVLLHPDWQERISALKRKAWVIAQSLGARPLCGIHRDYYADQLIVDDRQVWVIDFDLYCKGDPALDIGNFIAHITEQALRVTGDATAWQDQEEAMLRRYLALGGESHRHPIRVYAFLTLMRHIQLSTQFQERRHLTAKLLRLCEERAEALNTKPGQQELYA